MKKILKLVFVVAALISTVVVNAQEEESAWSVGTDVYSRYVWRGTDFGNAPAIQPCVAYAVGNFEIGAWGSYSVSSNVGGLEADLYVSYSIGGLSIGLTDYYFPGEALMNDGGIYPVRSGSYFDYENAHTFEAALGYEIGGLGITAAYMFSGDAYVELAYGFESGVSVFAGMGNEAYTVEGDFGVCNVGMSYEKEIKVTDSFSLPMSGSVILNPDTEQIHFVVGISL